MRQTGETAFVTGAFGGVGEWLIHELDAKGLAVVAFDKPSSANRKKAARLTKRHAFRTIWGDLTDAGSVDGAMAAARPDVVIHCGAVIPPLTVTRPDIGEEVNVRGTGLLITAAQRIGSVRRVVFVSSYSVLGPSNPHEDPAPWTSETPVDPQDDYARQKVAAERIVADGGLEYSIVRLCAVFPLDAGAMSADTMRFSFLLPFDRREHAIDIRDAALAIVNAALVPAAAGRRFVIGGGEGWQGLGGNLFNAVLASAGLPPLPREAYRQPDPARRESWYYENWVDTAESERVLRYQRYSFADYLAERRRRAGPARLIIKLLGRLLRARVLRDSPYHGRLPRIDPTPFADAAIEALRLQPSR